MSFLSQSIESGLGVIAVVYLSMFLDNVLLTVVVPIIPEHFYTQWFANASTVTNNVTRSAADLHQSFLPNSLKKTELQTLENENEIIGLLLSSKAIVQLFMNPLVGVLTSYVGYNVPIMLGSILLIVISVLFAYGETYVSLLVARSLQGTASALISVSGMCLVAEQKHVTDSKRSKMMGLVMGSIALGVLVGYPFGSILYDFGNKSTPFIVIIFAIAFDLGLQLYALNFNLADQVNSFNERLRLKQNTRYNGHQSAHFNNGNWKDLLKDGYILLVTFAICLTSSTMAILEPFLPIWLLRTINPEKWQLGTVFIPDSLGYLIGTNFFGSLSYTLGQWRMAVLATLLVGISAITIPSATTMTGLVCPHFGLGLGIGIVDSALVPMLANMVDTRHPDLHYGAVYALQQTAVSLAYSLGPVFGGRFVKAFGFPWLMRTVGIINVLYCGLLVFLSKASDGETDKIQSDASTIADYKSFFNRPIAYEQLDETDANN